MCAEGVGDGAQWLAQIFLQQSWLRNVIRNGTQTIHVIRKDIDARGGIGYFAQSFAHHRRARHLAKCANVRQS